MRSVTVLAPAKLNLTLDVTGTRPDGYHTLDMIMQAVSLPGARHFAQKQGTFCFRCPAPACRPTSTTPPIKRRWRFFTARASWRARPSRWKSMCPCARAWRAGRADAAAVLVGLNELYGARLSAAELCALGAQVGADVPFSIVGGTARVTGVGDILEPLKPCPPCFFTVWYARGRHFHAAGICKVRPHCTDVRPDSAGCGGPPSHGAIWRACARR